MADKPTIFADHSVRSILAGEKTKTRRIVKPQPASPKWTRKRWVEAGSDDTAHFDLKCPYPVGRILWVREAWAVMRVDYTSLGWEGEGIVELDSYKSKPADRPGECYYPVYRADGYEPCESESWRTPLFMPRWASRISLKVTAVKAERLQDITEEDAVAEGYEAHRAHRDYAMMHYHPYAATARDNFSYSWDTINKDKGWGWSENPYVWAVTFELCRP